MRIKDALVQTIQSRYSADSVLVRTNNERLYKLHVTQIAKMMNRFDFKVVKTAKGSYAIVNELLEIAKQ